MRSWITHDTSVTNDNAGFLTAGWTSDLKQFVLGRFSFATDDDVAWTVSSTGSALHPLGQGGLRARAVSPTGGFAWATTEPNLFDDRRRLTSSSRVRAEREADADPPARGRTQHPAVRSPVGLRRRPRRVGKRAACVQPEPRDCSAVR
jgi:hypothetical protein